MLNDQYQLFQSLKPVRASFFLVGVLVLVSIGVVHTYPPKPLSLSAPLSGFSAARAMAHVSILGAKPHPTGSRENNEIRDYLVTELKKLGLKPEIQSTFVVNPHKKVAGKIHNVLVRIQGTLSDKALLLAAHYDSVATGSGAADDGASVAAILEMLRALKTLPPLKNDLVCIFTDGEEAGLLGAEAFVQQHLWAKTIGLALNFEYRGNQGAFMMFEASQGNGKLIDGLATAVPFVLANSLMYEVYKYLPNDTDLSVFKKSGMQGMNFAAIEGHTSYHTQLDRPELLDQGSLQHEGDIMVALVKQFGNLPLTDLKAQDRIYFDLPGLGLVNYPVSWVFPCNVILLLLFAVVMTLGLRAKIIRISRVALAAIVFLVISLGLAAICYLLWQAICQLHPGYKTFIQGDTYNSQWYLLAFVFLSIGLFGLLQAWFSKWLQPIEFTVGVMLCWLLLHIICSVWLPGASFLFFWPLLAMLLGIGAILLGQGLSSQPSNALLILFGSIPGIQIFLPLIRELYVGLTPQLIIIVIVFLILILGLLTPLLVVLGQRRCLIVSSLFLCFVALISGSLTSGFDEEHPRQNTLFYALNNADNKAFWLSTDQALDQWTATYFPNATKKRQVPEIFGDNTSDLWVAGAPVLTLSSPSIELLEDGTMGSNRRIKLRVKSLRQAPKLKVTLEGVDVYSSMVAGQVYTQSLQSNWHIDIFGLSDEGIIIDLFIKVAKPFIVRVIDMSYGLPAKILKSRPLFTISRPIEFSDTTAVVEVLNQK